MTKEVFVDFSDEAYDTLVELAQKRNATMTAVLSVAIDRLSYLDSLQKSGGRIILEEKTGRRFFRRHYGYEIIF